MEKVEAKLKQKQDKRDNKTTDASANSNFSAYDSTKNASASQSISRKFEGAKEETNRSFDVIIENFDVSFGNK